MSQLIDSLQIAIDALKEIKENHGQVCEEFELCKHVACHSSVSCWMISDKALKDIKKIMSEDPFKKLDSFKKFLEDLKKGKPVL